LTFFGIVYFTQGRLPPMRSLRALWSFLGHVDSTFGRLGVLKWVLLGIGGLLLLAGIVNAFLVIGGVLFIAVGIGGFVSDRKRSARVAKRPMLQAGEFTEEIRDSKGGPDLQVIRVGIYNAADAGGDKATAFDVVPKLEAIDTSGEVVTYTRGVWAKDVFGKTPDTVTFKPTHEEHPLELVAKFPGQADAYLAGQDEPHLPPGWYTIRASLRGGNLDEPAFFEWTVQNVGVNQKLAISEANEFAPFQVRMVDQAARSASVVSSETIMAEPAFPRCEIEVKKGGFFDLKEVGRVLVFDVRITNRERTDRLSLRVDFVLQLFIDRKREGARPLETKLWHRKTALETQLSNPLDLAPQSSREGTYVVGCDLPNALDFDDDGLDFSARPRDRLAMRIRDHVSGASAEIEVPGVWTSP
jgi:hypothetical protein